MWLRYDLNEHGVQTSRHSCDTCGEIFTLTPAVAPEDVEPRGWENCLSPDCGSYDPGRDVDLWLASDPNAQLLVGQGARWN